jgi:pantoate--beta-alanine ligase
VQPDVAVFGRKDYQQLAVIRYMVARLSRFRSNCSPPTRCREADGLAMSSRNQYLSAEEAPRAATIQPHAPAHAEATLGGHRVSRSRNKRGRR